MFCPTCGRDNAAGRKFCVSCGTNLEAVSQALSDSKTDFLTKTDSALDHFLARYAEHVFKDAPSNIVDGSVGKSWKILGQGILTSLIDMILFSLMWNVFPLRFLFLLISSPIRLLNKRSERRYLDESGGREHPVRQLPSPKSDEITFEAISSISEHTTEKLKAKLQLEDEEPPGTGKTKWI